MAGSTALRRGILHGINDQLQAFDEMTPEKQTEIATVWQRDIAKAKDVARARQAQEGARVAGKPGNANRAMQVRGACLPQATTVKVVLRVTVSSPANSPPATRRSAVRGGHGRSGYPPIA